MKLMHDSVLLSVEFEWKSAQLKLLFDTYPAGMVALTAEGVTDIRIPRENPWGPSVHVNEVRKVPARSREPRKLEIEMQSGDTISITAASFGLPPQMRRGTVSLATTIQKE
jgi:hypothetical protein